MIREREVVVCIFSLKAINISIAFFGLGINRRPIIDFHFPLLAPISKRGSGTAAVGDDEWIMYQLCTSAKS